MQTCLYSLLFFITFLAFQQGANGARLGDIPEKPSSSSDDPFRNPPEKKPAANSDPTIEENFMLIQSVTEEFYQKGLKALNAGDLTTAEGYFDRVLVIKPNHKGAKQGIDRIMKLLDAQTPKQEKPKPPANPKEQLIKNLEQKLDKKMAEGNYEEALSIANEILAINPDNAAVKKKLATTNNKLFVISVNHGAEREEAGDERGAIDAYMLALNYKKDENLKSKVSALRERLSQKNRQKSSELYLQALQASQEGQVDKAVSLSRKALTLDPKNLQAQRMLERLAPQSPELNP